MQMLLCLFFRTRRVHNRGTIRIWRSSKQVRMIVLMAVDVDVDADDEEEDVDVDDETREGSATCAHKSLWLQRGIHFGFRFG